MIFETRTVDGQDYLVVKGDKREQSILAIVPIADEKHGEALKEEILQAHREEQTAKKEEVNSVIKKAIFEMTED